MDKLVIAVAVLVVIVLVIIWFARATPGDGPGDGDGPPRGRPGDVCSTTRDCDNGACGWSPNLSSGISSMRCCDDPKDLITIGQEWFCGNRKDGQACINDAHATCRSGYCEPGSPNGTCKGSRPEEPTCATTRDCANGACGQIVDPRSREPKRICCQNPADLFGQDGEWYCGGRSDGMPCLLGIDKACTGGACKAVGKSGTRIGVCGQQGR